MKRKLYMGIPATGTRLDYHTILWRDMQEMYGDSIELVFPDFAAKRFPHDYARNCIVEEFLASDCDALWFLDSDVVPPKAVLDLVKNQWDDWLVAGCPYPLWMTAPGTEEQTIMFTTYDGTCKDKGDGKPGIFMTECPSSGQKMVDAIATGCMFIKREVFSKLQKPYFEFKFDHDTRAVAEGEDLGFCLKLNKLGIKCLIDYSLVCGHIKSVDLLAINNYAITLSNKKILVYDMHVRQQVEEAVKAAMKKGYEQGLKDAKDKIQGKRDFSVKADSGLILPQHFHT